MAKAKKANRKKRKGKKGKPKGVSFKVNFFLAVLFLMAIVFLPTAIILFVGMLPFLVAFYVDKTKKKTRAITIGAMNLAGCMPFLLELWMTDPSMDKAMTILVDPMAIIVMYSAAGVGYIIDWAVTILVANFLYQRGVARKKAIEERQSALIDRWGEEVTGKIPLDHEGFPLEDTSMLSPEVAGTKG